MLESAYFDFFYFFFFFFWGGGGGQKTFGVFLTK